MSRAPRRRTSKPGKRSSSAAVTVSVNGEDVPRRPAKKDIEKLFLKTLALVPASRRPDIPAAFLKKLAVDVIVVNDARIAQLNTAHMRHKGPTDVLSFPMGEIDPERRVFNLGEIVVSSETAKREAAERGLPFEEELSRYCVHGFLHLLGYDDDTRTQREEMFAIQEKALSSH
ncbi:MAG TPA: rRNA maturation RNase YbeY [Planctomycetota bacterium]|nr:rRNA maturation RNase YbeY [Planctomycetota bacterium]